MVKSPGRPGGTAKPALSPAMGACRPARCWSRPPSTEVSICLLVWNMPWKLAHENATCVALAAEIATSPKWRGQRTTYLIQPPVPCLTHTLLRPATQLLLPDTASEPPVLTPATLLQTSVPSAVSHSCWPPNAYTWPPDAAI